MSNVKANPIAPSRNGRLYWRFPFIPSPLEPLVVVRIHVGQPIEDQRQTPSIGAVRSNSIRAEVQADSRWLQADGQSEDSATDFDQRQNDGCIFVMLSFDSPRPLT